LLESGRGEMRIAAGHLGIFMPKQRAYRLQGHATHGEVTGEGVAQVMKAETLNPSSLQGTVKGTVDSQDARSVQMAKQVGRGHMPGELGKLLIKGFVDWNCFPLVVLRLRDADEPMPQIQIAPSEPENLP
jgi:hypothetical protein